MLRCGEQVGIKAQTILQSWGGIFGETKFGARVTKCSVFEVEDRCLLLVLLREQSWVWRKAISVAESDKMSHIAFVGRKL